MIVRMDQEAKGDTLRQSVAHLKADRLDEALSALDALDFDALGREQLDPMLEEFRRIGSLAATPDASRLRMLAVLERLMEIPYAPIHEGLAHCLMGLRRFDGVIRSAQRALELDGDPTMKNSIMFAALSLGRSSDEIDALLGDRPGTPPATVDQHENQALEALDAPTLVELLRQTASMLEQLPDLDDDHYQSRGDTLSLFQELAKTGRALRSGKAHVPWFLQLS